MKRLLRWLLGVLIAAPVLLLLALIALAFGGMAYFFWMWD